MKEKKVMNLNSLISQIENGKTFDYLYFWMHEEKNENITKCCLSQWYPSPFTVNNILYPTAEHWMMASKAKLFQDDQSFLQIINSNHPKEVKTIGRKVKNFCEVTWSKECIKIVTQGNFEKFKQNPKLKEFLLLTNDSVLVEASPYDKIWGIGLNENNHLVKNPKTWKGTNFLGFALMDVRELLKS